MMKVTTLSIRLFLVFMVIQADCSNFTDPDPASINLHWLANKSSAVFPHIVPNRLQFFEYESVSVHCEVDNNITEWKVKWKSHKIKNASHTSTSPCTIYPTFESHSGEYWCETEGGIKSEALNITITAGSVILETPTHPVKEGNEVTLNCKNKETQSEHITDFYKDGVSLGTWNQSSMTIKNVSKSDEGLYKCSIDGAGESPESWLPVLKQHHPAPYNETDLSHEVPKISHDEFPKKRILLWIVIFVLLAALLVVVIVLVLHKKHKVRQDTTDLHQAKYAVGRKERKQKNGDNSDHPDDVLYVTIKNPWKKKETKLSRADMNPCCQEGTVIYSSVK